MTLPPDPTIAGALGDEGENVLGMMSLQRPQDVADARRDGYRDPPVALAKLDNLAGILLHFVPTQQALPEPQPGGTGEGEERRKVFAGGGVELIGLIIG